MKMKDFTRREFVKTNTLAGIGAAVAGLAPAVVANCSADTGVPAILGGEKIHSGGWPVWPQWKPEYNESLTKVMQSGVWSRADIVNEFEKKWAETIGSKRCLSVVNGTNALVTAVAMNDIGAGDEVIVTPYTWISTIQSVLLAGAIPVFADIDPETYQIDPEKIKTKITPRTKAILPVHILGMPADMDKIMAIGKEHNLIVIEDACQAWLAEVNHKKVGTIGQSGCFSFQNSKHLPLGEGGAVVSDDDAFIDKCYSFHNVGFPHGTVIGGVGAGSVMLGTKLRLTEYQAAIGLAQLGVLDEQTTMRNENAKYLRDQIKGIPGIKPYKLYKNVTRAAFHMFCFRYDEKEFKGLSRDKFLKALSAEGIPNLSGYAPFLNKQPYLQQAFNTKNFKKMYTAEELDFTKYSERNECPENDKLCMESVWLQQNMLLAEKKDLDHVADAIDRIRKNAEAIKNKS
jgi:dTDP-4-amino-4,6-dideoxygalactose transaminase